MIVQKLLQFISRGRRWFFVGIGLKRWVLVLGVGSACLGIGFVVAWVWFVRTLDLTNSAVYYVTTPELDAFVGDLAYIFVVECRVDYAGSVADGS